MTQATSPPPPEAACLFRPYPSSQKGGTLIAADVEDFSTHLARIRSLDGYRPERCPTCDHPVMHVHDYRERQCQLADAPPVIPIVRHCCANPECGAQWQTLPGFLARHLHFNWPRVEDVCEGRSSLRDGRLPCEKTVRRWLGRLASSAARLVRLLADGGRAAPARVHTRHQLIAALGTTFATVAAWIHALMPGVRLM
jgi:hypothetical protein